VQRPGDRGCREGEDIDHASEPFEFLLVFDTKSLLFIYDDQTKILESDVFLQQAVGSDHDIHPALFQPGDNLLLLGRGAKPAQAGHIHRVAPETFPERFIMLLGKHRGGNQQGHLLAVIDRDEGGP